MQLSSSNNKQRNRPNNNRVYTLLLSLARIWAKMARRRKEKRQEQIYKEIWTRFRRKKENTRVRVNGQDKAYKTRGKGQELWGNGKRTIGNGKTTRERRVTNKAKKKGRERDNCSEG